MQQHHFNFSVNIRRSGEQWILENRTHFDAEPASPLKT